jgi:hypothetical protein
MKIQSDIVPCHVSVAPATFEDGNLDLLQSHPQQDGAFYIQTARVIVITNDVDVPMVVIATDSPDGAQIVFQESIQEFIKNPKQEEDSKVKTSSGKMLAFKKDTNCGCGSRLRSWNPYRTLSSTKDPSA